MSTHHRLLTPHCSALEVQFKVLMFLNRFLSLVWVEMLLNNLSFQGFSSIRLLGKLLLASIRVRVYN